MILASREYVSLIGIGNREECIRLLFDLHKELETLSNEKIIIGSTAQTLYSLEQIQEEQMDPKPILAVCQGRYPLVWANVTFDPAVIDRARLTEVEQKFRCVYTNGQEIHYRD
jgi:hypothetical protein